MDDATSEVYSVLFVAEELPVERLSVESLEHRMQQQGLPSSFYNFRGPHCPITPKAGGFLLQEETRDANPCAGRAVQELGFHMILSY